jgi:hypothetical protein
MFPYFLYSSYQLKSFALLNSLELHKNWRCGSHSVLIDVRNFCPYLPHLLPDFGKIRHKLCTHNALENLEFSKTKSVQGCPYFSWWAEINLHWRLYRDAECKESLGEICLVRPLVSCLESYYNSLLWRNKWQKKLWFRKK